MKNCTLLPRTMGRSVTYVPLPFRRATALMFSVAFSAVVGLPSEQAVPTLASEAKRMLVLDTVVGPS